HRHLQRRVVRNLRARRRAAREPRLPVGAAAGARFAAEAAEDPHRLDAVEAWPLIVLRFTDAPCIAAHPGSHLLDGPLSDGEVCKLRTSRDANPRKPFSIPVESRWPRLQGCWHGEAAGGPGRRA